MMTKRVVGKAIICSICGYGAAHARDGNLVKSGDVYRHASRVVCDGLRAIRKREKSGRVLLPSETSMLGLIVPDRRLAALNRTNELLMKIERMRGVR